MLGPIRIRDYQNQFALRITARTPKRSSGLLKKPGPGYSVTPCPLLNEHIMSRELAKLSFCIDLNSSNINDRLSSIRFFANKFIIRLHEYGVTDDNLLKLITGVKKYDCNYKKFLELLINILNAILLPMLKKLTNFLFMLCSIGLPQLLTFLFVYFTRLVTSPHLDYCFSRVAASIC